MLKIYKEGFGTMLSEEIVRVGERPKLTRDQAMRKVVMVEVFGEAEIGRCKAIVGFAPEREKDTPIYYTGDFAKMIVLNWRTML